MVRKYFGPGSSVRQTSREDTKMLGKLIVTHMTQDKTDKAPCPDAQTLAAFVDNTLPMEKRGEVKTHLADCGRCLAILAETLKTH